MAGKNTQKQKPSVNKTRPEVKITLDKERTLKLDLNAMVAFEEATGKSLVGGFDSGSMTPRDLRAMLWACLIHEDDELTEKQVGALVTADNMLDIASKLNDAFEVAMPETEKTKKGGGKEPGPLAASP